MTETTPEAVAETDSWLHEVCDALNINQSSLDDVQADLADLVHHVATTPGDQDDAPMTAFLIGFAAAKDGDFSPEAVKSRVAVVANILEKYRNA